MTNMAQGRDGGRAAIAGFLYQVVGVLGFQAHAYDGNSTPDTGGHEVSLLVQRIQSAAAVTQERFDQDALIELSGGSIAGQNENQAQDAWDLVQFKYSANRSAIGPQELRKISDAFGRGQARAQQLGFNINERFLVTNRIVVQENENWAREQGITLVQRQTLDGWIDRLRHFGYGHGCTDDEIEAGIGNLVFTVMSQISSGQDAQVTETQLKEAFSGNRNAARLTLASVHNTSKQDLSQVKLQLDFDLSDQPLRRSVVDRIAELVAARRALILLKGDGGCGKTVALWQWVWETSGETTPQGLAAFLPALSVTRTCITEQVCKWGNYGPQHPNRWGERPIESIQRLRLANPSLSSPIYHLGLDGADEVTDVKRQDELREVLSWFWRQDLDSLREHRDPAAVLVVTCRHERDIFKWLDFELTGFASRGDRPQMVVIERFSDQELEQLAKETLSNELYLKIKAALVIGRSEEVQDRPEERALQTTGRSANTTIVEALKHPAMWHSFSKLMPSESEREKVLDGDEEALSELARSHVDWFCNRAERRGIAIVGNQTSILLAHIARGSYSHADESRTATLSDWTGPAHRDFGEVSQAKQLFQEALSVGLIEQPMGPGLSWRWRHRFVAQYLAEKVEYAHG